MTHRPRGGLRPRGRRDPLRHRRGRAAPSRTRRPTGCRDRSGAETSAVRYARRRRCKSGVVSVNCNNSVHVEAPFGGYKQSGHRQGPGPRGHRRLHRRQERVRRPRLGLSLGLPEVGRHGGLGRAQPDPVADRELDVLKAISGHGIASGANARSRALRGRPPEPPLTDASNAIMTTAASSREYSPTISPGSTIRPVSSSVSRIAASLTVSSTSRNPPGCAHQPRPGSMPAAQQDELAGVRDRQRRDDEARVDVGDEPAGRAGQPVAILVRQARPNASSRAAARAVVEHRAEPVGHAGARGDVRGAAVGPAADARPVSGRLVVARSRRSLTPTPRARAPRGHDQHAGTPTADDEPTPAGTGPCRDPPASTPRPSARSGASRRAW